MNNIRDILSRHGVSDVRHMSVRDVIIARHEAIQQSKALQEFALKKGRQPQIDNRLSGTILDLSVALQDVIDKEGGIEQIQRVNRSLEGLYSSSSGQSDPAQYIRDGVDALLESEGISRTFPNQIRAGENGVAVIDRTKTARPTIAKRVSAFLLGK